MATINEMIYDVREQVNKYSDDSNISNRYIIHKINTVRNKFLTQSLNNFKGIKGKNVLQKFCTELEKVDSSTCGDFLCDTILRTKEKIPNTLQLVGTQSIVRIKPTNVLSQKISFISLDRAEYIEGSSFQNSLYGFLNIDDYLYIYSHKGDYKNLSCLEITGIFSNPMELENYTNCCDCDSPELCFDPDIEDYPVFDYMISDIIEVVTQMLLRKDEIPLDQENDSNER